MPARMNLDDVLFRTVGRAPKPCEAEIVRELTVSDLPLLLEEKGYEISALKRISDRHHRLARCLASGMPAAQAAVVCNYTRNRISILQDDPAFKELLDYYRNSVEEQYTNLHEQLAGIARDAAWVLQERLEEEPEKLSTGQLLELTKMGADRTGHGPSASAQTNIQNNYVVALPEKATSDDDWLKGARVLENKNAK